MMLDDRHDILESAFPGQSERFFLAMSIGGTPELADDGAALILNGTKTATSSPLWNYAAGRIPFVGALSVLLDGRAPRRCAPSFGRLRTRSRSAA